MERVTAYLVPVWAIGIFFVFILIVVAIFLVVPPLLGERHRERATDLAYESGIVSTGTARLRVDVQFYLVGVIFLIFDIETAFVLAWAVAFKRLGWAGFIEIFIFIGMLALVLVYLSRSGALDWRRKSPAGRRAP